MKITTPRIHPLALTLPFTLFFALPLTLHSQTIVAKGVGTPKKVPKGTYWYFDTAHHTAWGNSGIEWTELGIEGVTEMYPAGTMVVIHSKLGYSLLGPYGDYIWAAPDLRVTDSLVMVWDEDYTQIYLLTGRQLHPMDGFDVRCWPIAGEPETVQGIKAFCLPDFQASFDSVPCDSLHAFGMFGYNGHWLIAPQYEEAFQFQDGVAEVVYQGQRRKINEQGEFVE